MRLILLLLLSMCVFAEDVEPRLPTGKALPTWIKDLSHKWDMAAGDGAPWRGETKKGDDSAALMRSKAEKVYREAYETALDTFAKTMKQGPQPTVPNEARDYWAQMSEYAGRARLSELHRVSQWQPNDVFFITYAKLNNDPTAYGFLWLPKNREKYLR